MRKYPANIFNRKLQPWPFEGKASNYEIIRGNPKASGRLDLGSNEGQHRMGIWSCTEGAFTCTEVGDELQTVISGHLTITRDDHNFQSTVSQTSNVFDGFVYGKLRIGVGTVG